MDIINNRTRDIAHMALDGLYERTKAISCNTANALTPNYQRKEVSFEKSLQNVIKNEDLKEEMKIKNSIQYQKQGTIGQSPEQIAFLNSIRGSEYIIDVQNDLTASDGLDGNNVNVEKEMMDEMETGMKYQVVSSLLSKSYKTLGSIINGQNQ